MLQTVLLTFFAGILAGNSTPHFVKGITKERYPTVFGASPVVNLVVGWAGLVLAALMLQAAHVSAHAAAAEIAGALGVLVIGGLPCRARRVRPPTVTRDRLSHGRAGMHLTHRSMTRHTLLARST